MAVQIVILAAGKGKRMHSDVPKMLHQLGGVPLIMHAVKTATSLTEKLPPLAIIGHEGAQIQNVLSAYSLKFIQQEEQLGTAHAVLQALPHLADDSRVLILYGDVPLLSTETLKKLIQETPSDALGLLTVNIKNPTGYGRIIRNASNDVTQIIEEKDADAAVKNMTEVNPGIYLVPAKLLKKWLPQIKNKNQQNEYYLTDIIAQAVHDKIKIVAIQPNNLEEVMGVNDCAQLNELERFFQLQQAQLLMQAGVTIYDSKRLDIRGNLKVGKDVTIDVDVIIEGDVTIGDRCSIGPFTHLRNTTIANDVQIKSHCTIDGAKIKEGAIIGPFARIRPGTELGTNTHVGNFVEIKNSQIADESKVNHLSYIGDSEVGKRVNIGAGTITCNYDGAKKHKTIIADDVHIGSDTQLVAPVRVGEGATIGAGSTITKDVPPQTLTVSHKLEQRTLNGWVRPQKED